MPIDAYSLCPGGTGKKLKFCCNDLVAELEKIDRMVEGEQHVACLQHIDRLLEHTPDRACLMAIKAMLLRVTGQVELAQTHAADFVAKHPDNPVALAESAIMTAVSGDGPAAAKKIFRAIALSKGTMTGRVYEAMDVVARALISQGEWLAARGLLQLQIVGKAQDDQRPLQLWAVLNQSNEVPLLLKDDALLPPPPDDAPWKARLEEAIQPIGTGDFLLATQQLAALAAEFPQTPAVWHDLAKLRGWTADTPGAIEALRKFAALEAPLEDAAEAEAKAMLLSSDPLGDALDLVEVNWTVHDVEQLQMAMTLDKRVVQIPVDRALADDDDNPPPKGAYWILDRPALESAQDLTLEAIPLAIGELLLFGRQTDREARLEAHQVLLPDLPRLKSIVSEFAGDTLAPDATHQVTGQVSASEELLQRKWRLPQGVSREQIKNLAREHQRDALLVRWPQLPLGVLDGKSPAQAAPDPSLRIRVLGAILVLQSWNDEASLLFDFNQLRAHLGLPVLEPIDPQTTPIRPLPLVRLSRIEVEKASDQDLLDAYHRARAFRIVDGLRTFAQAIVARPSLASRPERITAYEFLARTEEDTDRAIQYVEEGRKATLAAGHSCAAWDLMELPMRLVRGEAQELSRISSHLQQRHLREAGVAEAFMQFLVSAGVINPDGTPAVPPQMQQSVVAAPDVPAAQPGKLWTPGAQESTGEKKLWTPG